MTMANVILFV